MNGEDRAVTIHQLNLLATIVKLMVMKRTLIDGNKYSKNFKERITWINVNMYHICTHAVKPLSAKDRCSWIELVASGAQKPTWFLSHSWGTPFNETMQMLEFFQGGARVARQRRILAMHARKCEPPLALCIMAVHAGKCELLLALCILAVHALAPRALWIIVHG